MKILFVAMAQSVHVGRWISQIKDQGWDIHLFPSQEIPDSEVHYMIKNATLHQSLFGGKKSHHSIRRKGMWIPNIPFVSFEIAQGIRRRMGFSIPEYRTKSLANVINRIKPDIIHVIEFQHAGYLFLDAISYIKGEIPKVIVTNWGSDIFLFQHLKIHKERIIKLLSVANYYDCECERDVLLAQELGFNGKVLPVLPNTGGFNLEQIQKIHTLQSPSQRQYIILKGYQNWSGRALFGLKALDMVADLLNDYNIIIYSVEEDIMIAGQLFEQKHNVPVLALKSGISHEEMLHYFGQSRIYLGIGISDGLSTAMVEAMGMGAFPIQTGTACADEWLIDGETGIIINDPEDCQEIAAALRRALSDDHLVDTAATKNWEAVAERLDENKIKSQIIQIYRDIYDYQPE